ncbi:hypothetical protein GCM10027515_26710 [Schumannella luteola]|uniref:Uncharacterized protein n=1 Tax=Schumannella luteola TaxID=472059 RepID=A0A852YCH2_9MICO|nr:hypothetical protein [Schumannella luteola]NYG99532.1 hypothetical protein [Schumannella luteola]TPX03851.1 hypothetical protein FJ656_15075 [Schumannella luteola]
MGERYGSLVVIQTGLRAPRTAKQARENWTPDKACEVICTNSWEHNGTEHTCGRRYLIRSRDLGRRAYCIICRQRQNAASVNAIKKENAS